MSKFDKCSLLLNWFEIATNTFLAGKRFGMSIDECRNTLSTSAYSLFSKKKKKGISNMEIAVRLTIEPFTQRLL